MRGNDKHTDEGKLRKEGSGCTKVQNSEGQRLQAGDARSKEVAGNIEQLVVAWLLHSNSGFPIHGHADGSVGTDQNSMQDTAL